MTRTRSILAVVAGALAWAAVTACNQQTIPTPLRSFDRPSDVALTCVQFAPGDSLGKGVFNVRPIGDCDPNIAARNQNLLPSTGYPSDFLVGLGNNAPFLPFLMPLVTQSARGELALVDAAQNHLVDSDPRTPGFNFLPVGKGPEHVRASGDSCIAVTANTDSCDLSTIDVPVAINNSQLVQLGADLGTAAARGDVTSAVHRQSFVAGTAAAPRVLQSRPSWIEMAPAHDGKDGIPGYMAGGTPGLCVGGIYKAWVALPACQLVVKVRLDIDAKPDVMALPLPNIEAAVRVTRSGATVLSPSELETLDCPAECGAASDGGGADLALPTDMGATPLVPKTQASPSTIAIDTEGGRMIIGDLDGERLDILPLDSATGALGAPRKVQLEAGAGGVRVVRVGPRSQAGKFAYAIARDGTVRVVDLDREVECETNPDPRYAGNGIDLQQTPTSSPALAADPTPQARQLGCFPLSGDPTRDVRRDPLATSPGISLSQGELPTDVAFVHVELPPGSSSTNVAPPAASPGLLVGDFAWIISSNGRGSVVNIFDACPQPNQQNLLNTAGPFTASCSQLNVDVSNAQTRVQYGHPEAMLLDRVSHRLRAGHPRFAQPLTPSDPTGQPRVADEANACAVAVPPTSPGAPDGGVSDGGVCNGATSTLPSLYPEQIPTPLIDPTQPNNPDIYPLRVIRFVDPDRARNETWALAWEGVLPGSDRTLAEPRATGELIDPGGQWCTRGVLAGDKVEFRGCTVDTDCDQAGKQLCVHDPGAFTDVTQGLCLPIGDVPAHTVEYWSGVCGKLLRAQRKYRILSARLGGVTSDVPEDRLLLAEISEPEYAEETTTCTTDADCTGITVPGKMAGMVLQTTCQADLDPSGPVKRCLLTCKDVSSDNDCGADFECASSQIDGKPRCMRAPIGPWKDPDALAKGPGMDLSCFPERQEYQIHVGDAFLVVGTSNGLLTNESTGPNGECIVPAESSPNHDVRERQARIPLTPRTASGALLMCGSTGALDSMNPALGANVCVASDDANGRVVHFENPIFNLAVEIPKPGTTYPKLYIPPDGTTISIAVTGGGNPLVTPLGVDVQAQQPRYLTVAPDRQTVYLVDEGKGTNPAQLRGQLLRLFSPSQSVDSTFVVR